MSNHIIQISAGTNIGLVRTNNEDNFVTNPDLCHSDWIIPNATETIDLGELGCLLAVADGMGGANAGEVASAIAMDTIQQLFAPDKISDKIGSEEAIRNFMTSAVKTADLNIVNHSKNDSSTKGMGTTIVLCWLLDEKAYICWCGDSRCYVFNPASGLCRLSKDHSYVQQLIDEGVLAPENAMDHPYSNVITRCLGDENVRAEPDFRTYDVVDGDCFLLCSDGLHGLCTDEEIISIMQQCTGTIADLRDQLVQAALNAGGYDNVTVVLGRVNVTGDTEDEEEDNNKIENKFSKTLPTQKNSFLRKLGLTFLLVFIILLCAACWLYRSDINAIIEKLIQQH